MQSLLKNKKRGVLLLEVLVALALFFAIAAIIAQALAAGFASEKISRTRAIGIAALEEMFAQVRAAQEAHWDTIGGLKRGVPYSISQHNGAFIIATGSASIVVDGIPYALSFVLSDSNRALNATNTPLALVATSSSLVDKSSLIVDGAVSWASGGALSLRTVLTRWRNVVCGQTSWSGAATSAALCEATNVGLQNAKNIQAGNSLMLCNGCSP